jgi:signal transduction histidine kinase
VSTAIANAQARDDLRRLADEQAALRRVATLVASGEAPEAVFRAVTEEVNGLLGLDSCLVWRQGTGPMPRRDGQVAVPIRDGRQLWGAILVEETDEQPLAPDAEEELSRFAELATMSIANARARDELRRVADEQAALRRVATLVAESAEPAAVFAAVAEEVGRLFSAVRAYVARYDDDEHEIVTATWDAANTAGVIETGTSVAASITVAGSPWGVVRVASTVHHPLPPGTQDRLAGFTELVATAIANAEAQAELTASRARMVTSADDTRRRIERDLNEGPQQQLSSLALQLRSIQKRIPPDGDGLAAELVSIVAGLRSALEELQVYARGIHPAFLSEGGLEPALKTLTRRARVPVDLRVQARRRLPEPVEVAAYYVVSEALTNAAKHAQATGVTIDVEADNLLRVRIQDDGIGGAVFTRGSGLVGLRDRVEALGGRIALASESGSGTALSVELPLAVGG